MKENKSNTKKSNKSNTKNAKDTKKKTTKKKTVEKKITEKKTTKKKSTEKKTTVVRKKYYLFKMNTLVLNGFSIILILLSCLIFYLIYGNNSMNVLTINLDAVIILYLPYLVFHELLHSLAYVIYGADFKNITYGAHLEKGILCCLCKQNINKKNILHSLLYPFVFIGVLTLILGIVINNPLVVILSLTNITGCSGDLVMFYHLRKLDDFEFSEYNDPIAFGLYTKKDFSTLKMFGLDYVDKKTKLERDDLRKVVISKPSIIILIAFYLLMIITMVA